MASFIQSHLSDKIRFVINPCGKRPGKMTQYSGGYDIASPCDTTIVNGVIEKLDLKFKMQLPEGYCGLLMMRSSYATRGAVVLGGLIDSDYRGSIHAVISNLMEEPIKIKQGERFIQLVPVKIGDFDSEVVETLSPTERNTGGFGSSNTTSQP